MPLLLPVASATGTARTLNRIPWGPGSGVLAAGALSGSTVALDATADAAALITQIAKSGSVTEIGIPISVKTSTSASVKYLVGVYNLSAGAPDLASAYGSMAPANPTQASTTQSVTNWFVLATPSTVVAGDTVAFVISHDTGSTAPTTQNITVRTRFSGALTALPHIQENTTGSWAKTQGIPAFSYKYSDGTVVGPSHVSATPGPTAYVAESSPDERGALFQLPFACKSVGARLFLKSVAASAGTVKLYSAADALLESASLIASALAFGNFAVVNVAWPERAHAALTDYRLTLLATSAGADTLQPAEYIVDAAGSRTGFPEGARWQGTTRADAGAWTDTATVVPIMALLLSEVTS